MDKHQTPQDRYTAKAIRRYALNLNRNTNADILAHLEGIDNIQGYIKSLILADMARHDNAKKAGA